MGAQLLHRLLKSPRDGRLGYAQELGDLVLRLPLEVMENQSLSRFGRQGLDGLVN